MILTVEQLKRIVAAGGGLVLDAPTFTFNQLSELAQATQTASRRGSLTLKEVGGLTAEQLAELSLLAPGQIVFDLSG
jgi:hypothetical protein